MIRSIFTKWVNYYIISHKTKKWCGSFLTKVVMVNYAFRCSFEINQIMSLMKIKNQYVDETRTFLENMQEGHKN